MIDGSFSLADGDSLNNCLGSLVLFMLFMHEKIGEDPETVQATESRMKKIEYDRRLNRI